MFDDQSNFVLLLMMVMLAVACAMTNLRIGIIEQEFKMGSEVQRRRAQEIEDFVGLRRTK